jgi:hypothetical protein
MLRNLKESADFEGEKGRSLLNVGEHDEIVF